MNQSKIKSKVTLIALLSIVLVFALLIVSVVEIRQYHILKQQIAKQEQQIEDLKNAKDYYEDKLKEEGFTSDDLVFEEE